MNNKKPTLFLLDAMALAYRAYFALIKNPVRNSQGVNTSAVLGFGNVLLDILEKEKPDYIGVATDSYETTERAQEFEYYKANREPMPDELAASLPLIKELIKLMNIPLIEVPGQEADDIIGTLAKKAEKLGIQVFMMTPDKDFGQLVSENIKIFKPAKAGKPAEILGVEEICALWSIEKPEQLIDILAIMGDKSDNIPGIMGIGEVGAKKLVGQFGSVENMLEHIAEISTASLREKVQANVQAAIDSKRLATINTQVDIDFSANEYEWKIPTFAPLKEFFDTLEFRTFAKRMQASFYSMTEKKPSLSNSPSLFDQDFVVDHEMAQTQTQSILSEDHDYHLIDNLKDLDILIASLSQCENFSFDTETSSLDTLSCELVGISISRKPTTGSFIYLKNPDFREKALEKLKPIFEDQAKNKIGLNLKFDISVLRSHGINVQGRLKDVMIAHYLLQPEMRHNLDYLAENYLQYKTVSFEELTGGKKNFDLFLVDSEKLKEYACEDADIALRLWNLFEPGLHEKNMMELYNDIEAPLIYTLENVERNGVAIDIRVLKEYSEILSNDIQITEKEIYELAGEVFNISSPQQLGKILFEKLIIDEKPQKTKTKQYSTGEDILQKYIHKHPIIQKILDYRGLTKLKSTYVDALPELIHPHTGLIHTSFNQAVTATGRLSSTGPNLQNIPIRTERGREIRKAFVPSSPSHVILSADYSQIELRIMASICRDEAMKEAFATGKDIHTATASKIYKTPLEEVSNEQRRHAKTVNFGIIYGISAFGLAERLGIPRGQAADIIKEYFLQFPKVREFMDQTILDAKSKGFVATLKNRRRYLPDINSSNSFVRGFAERNAINAPIQGSAADMIKIAMNIIHQKLDEGNFKTRMILQVHDELVFDVPENELEELKNIIVESMENALPLDVPVKAECGFGKNWLEAH